MVPYVVHERIFKLRTLWYRIIHESTRPFSVDGHELRQGHVLIIDVSVLEIDVPAEGHS